MDVWIYGFTLIWIFVLYKFKKVFNFIWNVLSARRKLLQSFPAPEYHWLYGHLKSFPGLNDEGFHWNNDAVVKFPRYYVFLIGPMSRLELHHPETIRELTKTDEPKQFSLGAGYGLLLPWIGDGLLNSSGSKWFRNRRLLTPGFHFDILKPYVAIYNNSAESLMKWFESKSENAGKSVDIYQPVGCCTLDIILRCAFSAELDVHAQSEGKDTKYVKTIAELGKQAMDRYIDPLLQIDWLYFRSRSGKAFLENCRFSHKIADDVIDKRKLELSGSETFEKLSQQRYIDFLDILLLAKDSDGNGLSRQEIRDEVETFMFEGHDTTTSAISWALYNLARHPEIQSKARDEIDNLLADRDSDAIKWDDMNRMPYLTRCIKESMRLHPPVPLIGRETTKPLELDDKTVPRGVYVDINIWNLHHNPDIWTDPMTYNPDRFLPEHVNKMHSHAFLPFSAGSRNCIGQNFAMQEIKTTIGRIIRCFEISVDKTKPVRMQQTVVLRAQSGIHLFFNKRKELS